MIQKALFGAGCFWGVEEHFRTLEGVNSTKVGYSGGNTINPTYESVCYQNTDHAEVLQVEFNEKVISFESLVEEFWKCHDPTTLDRQGLDVGRQYRSVIYYFNDQQKTIAENSKEKNQIIFINRIVT
jgi:peptide-methionine (S)-S-oxide reductase